MSETETERKEQERLAEHYKESEEKIFRDAQNLIHTVQDSERDITGLHAKLKRKRSVEQKNYLTLETFKQSLLMQLNSQNKMFSEYSNLHSSHINSLRLAVRFSSHDNSTSNSV